MPVSLRRDLVPPEERRLEALDSAINTLDLEAKGLSALYESLKADGGYCFGEAIEILRNCRSRVIVTGIGKSGHVGLKVAATLSSTGTPAHFVHPSEASHGDLGMITRDDAILVFSWSGETVELGNIVSYSRRFAVPLIAVTSNRDSTLAQAAEVVLALPHAKEACPHGLAPTTSTVMQLALGDCIAIALLESKGFTAIDFKALHPGGQLGARLKFVSDLMHKGDRLPLAAADVVMGEAIVVMTEKALGCLGVVDGNGMLKGIITDGDLRRHMGNDLLALRAADIMTPEPKTVAPDLLASAALELINASKITALFVVENGRPVGIIHIHDLLRAGVA
ncbi:MAG: KpsF/GutQ family sugar-phosphate isomerase [Methyloceanibacter sp.]|uniref:KpsF/GutQ family sugar-phosphate isomerase n=1 Tax=Methyloceanibacter sp. TaxID=1965321 RepID=UPI003D6D08E1